VAVLLAWVTFLAGGVYPWVWAPAFVGVALVALSVRPSIARAGRSRALDLALLASVLAVAAQLVPLPASWLRLIDPHAPTLRAVVWLAPSGAATGSALPISIVPADTWSGLGIFAAALLLYWTCRAICEQGGTGRVVRSIAVIGLVGSLAAIVQRVENQELLYGFWRPLDAGARPYGPFVNRNHFAAWVIMACPLVFGYLLARLPPPRPLRLAQKIANALKALGTMRVWLVSSICLMTLALLLSTSRSGVVGLVCAMAASAWLSRQRGEGRVRRWAVLQASLLVAVTMLFANFDALAGRFDETLQESGDGRGRSAVWADAKKLISDFPMTGSGIGTFATAIGPYQRAEPGYSIGQAHNHYLQIAAEGGLLVSAPAALAGVMFLGLFWSRMLEDRTPDALLRAGAAAGLAGVLIQSFWETGLRMPANALLCATAAAIATHAPRRN
jgi:O-antigen ligase